MVPAKLRNNRAHGLVCKEAAECSDVCSVEWERKTPHTQPHFLHGASCVLEANLKFTHTTTTVK